MKSGMGWDCREEEILEPLLITVVKAETGASVLKYRSSVSMCVTHKSSPGYPGVLTKRKITRSVSGSAARASSLSHLCKHFSPVLSYLVCKVVVPLAAFKHVKQGLILIFHVAAGCI